MLVACSFYSFATVCFYFSEFLMFPPPISVLFPPILAQKGACLIASVQKVKFISVFDSFCVDAKDASSTRKLREQALREPPENNEKEPTK